MTTHLPSRSRMNYPETVAVSAPNQATVAFVEGLAPRPQVVAEIGVYRGHTSRELLRLLPADGQLHLFDFADTVDRVTAELDDGRVTGHGNSQRTLDSYNWSLMRVLERHHEPIYDYVLIDGAHTWVHDGLAFLLVDRLLKAGGHVDFDDYSWTLAKSPSLNPDAFPKTAEWYTDEQIGTRQVERVVELLVRRDDRYVEVVDNRIFRKERA